MIENIIEKKANELKRKYQREYREKNKDKINARRREIYKDNKNRFREYNRKCWNNKALKQLEEGEMLNNE